MRSDLGDFQTPIGLVREVLDRLDALGVGRERVFEPTCGVGRFLSGLLERPGSTREFRGVEIQPEHLEKARCVASEPIEARFEAGDIFDRDLSIPLDWSGSGALLIVGNPPWVTSASLGRLGSTNRPPPARIEGLVGLDARTGGANFDLAEALWIKVLRELSEPEATIALLCKASTARSVFRWAARARRPIASASLYRIDARRWFDAAVDACLFVVGLRPGGGCGRIDVFDGLEAERPSSTIAVVDGQLVSDPEALGSAIASGIYGRGSRPWRQGVKHDAADVMELRRDGDGDWRNGCGEVVDVEAEHVFPLLKGSDLGASRRSPPRRGVIVTQTRLGESPDRLRSSAPKLWAYLGVHADVLDGRRSKVYSGRPRFAMFGVGSYTFAPHKVAVSGFAKATRFVVVGSVEGRPTLLDDTCYFLPFESAEGATLAAEALDGPAVRGLIRSLTFPDAKRPITKAILQRIDLDRLLETSPRGMLAGPLGVE